MKPEDKTAFEAWYLDQYGADADLTDGHAFSHSQSFEAGMAHRDAQPDTRVGEPVAMLKENYNGDLVLMFRLGYDLQSFPVNTCFYTRPAPSVAQEPVLQRVMGRLADLLDEDQFAEIEGMVVRAGIAPPPTPTPTVAVNEQMLKALKACDWHSLDLPEFVRTEVEAAIAEAEAAKGGV